MRRPGIKTRKKAKYYQYDYYHGSSKSCQQRYCISCCNTYCRRRKANNQFKGYNPPKPKVTKEELVAAEHKRRHDKNNLFIKMKIILFIFAIASIILYAYIINLRY